MVVCLYNVISLKNKKFWVKLDVLRLQQLDIIQQQTRLIKEYYNIDLDMNNLPLDDDKTWDLLCNCDTLGIFQMESEIGKGIIRKIKPRNLEELSSINAFIRPGTSGLENYVAAKKDISNKKLYHPIIDKILEPTYGSIIYQETIMSLISAMMGMSFGKADILRRALEKPNKKGNAEKVEYFKENCVTLGMEHGISKEACEQIKQDILDNAGYLFNKSHSITYSYITYEMAYLKANYPLVFYLSALSFEGTDKIQGYMVEARSKGITILPPDVLKSKYECTIEDKENNVIRAGLKLIKGLGDKSVDDILNAQNEEIKSLNDYLEKAKGKAVGKGSIVPLICIGAMENLPLVVNKSNIKNVDDFNIKEINDEQVMVHLNRLQQELWVNEYLELKAKKTIVKYAIPITEIKGRYLEEFDDGDLIIEKDNTLVIPEDYLMQFGYDINTAECYKNNRKKAKGIFVSDIAQNNMSKEQLAFINIYDKLKRVVVNNKELYLSDLREFDMSFLLHPLEKFADKIKPFETFKENANVKTAGILTSIETRTTKTNKTFYTMILSTPHENVKLTVWNEMFNKHDTEFVLGNVLKIKGKASQKFGSITVSDVELAKNN